jgi:hypothetical protein
VQSLTSTDAGLSPAQRLPRSRCRRVRANDLANKGTGHSTTTPDNRARPACRSRWELTRADQRRTRLGEVSAPGAGLVGDEVDPRVRQLRRAYPTIPATVIAEPIGQFWTALETIDLRSVLEGDRLGSRGNRRVPRQPGTTIWRRAPDAFAAVASIRR